MSIHPRWQMQDRRRVLPRAHTPYPLHAPPPRPLRRQQNLQGHLEEYHLARTMGGNQEVRRRMPHLPDHKAANPTPSWQCSDDAGARETMAINQYGCPWPLSPLQRFRTCIGCGRPILISHQTSADEKEIHNPRYHRCTYK